MHGINHVHSAHSPFHPQLDFMRAISRGELAIILGLHIVEANYSRAARALKMRMRMWMRIQNSRGITQIRSALTTL